MLYSHEFDRNASNKPNLISGMEDFTSQMVFKCLKIQDLPFTFPKLGGK